MTTPRAVEQLVEGYLERLDRAAEDLPPDRRDELLDGIREHIAAARAAGAAADEAAVRTLLDRLGTPEEIVAAARDDDSGGPPASPGGAFSRASPGSVATGTVAPPVAPPSVVPADRVSPWGPLEIGAVVVLGVGGCLVPFVGTLAGLVLAYFSPRWNTREKVLASVLAVGPAVVALTLVLLAGTVA